MRTQHFNRRASLALVALGLFSLYGCLTAGGEKRANLEEILSHASYNSFMPVTGVNRTLHSQELYQQQVENRLVKLEELLRSRDVRDWPEDLQKVRMENLDRLRNYRLRGEFPTNYDFPGQQLPCFYDRDGHLCAVANLIAESDGMELVEKINNRYQYATVSQMSMPELDAWVARSGLTREEVITIQEPGSFGEPSYTNLSNQIALTPADVSNDASSATELPQQVQPVQSEPILLNVTPNRVQTGLLPTEISIDIESVPNIHTVAPIQVLPTLSEPIPSEPAQTEPAPTVQDQFPNLGMFDLVNDIILAAR